MIAVGLAMLWGSYTLFLYGWIRMHQMQIGFFDLIIPGKYRPCEWHDAVVKGKDFASQPCVPAATDSTTSSVAVTGAGTAQFEGVTVAAWMAPLLSYARQHGFSGTLTSGYRSAQEQAQVCATGVQPCATPGTSHHQGMQYPDGALDFTPPYTAPQQFIDTIRNSGLPGATLLEFAGNKDPVHVSIPGPHRSGESSY